MSDVNNACLHQVLIYESGIVKAVTLAQCTMSHTHYYHFTGEPGNEVNVTLDPGFLPRPLSGLSHNNKIGCELECVWEWPVVN